MRSKWIRTFLATSALALAPFLGSSDALAAPQPKPQPKPKIDCAKPENQKKAECKTAGNAQTGPARQIELEEENQKPKEDGPVVAGNPTEEAATAQRLFDAGKWAEAAIGLYRVWGGPEGKSATGDDPGNQQIAQFHLAVALFKLQFYQASFIIFGEIAGKPNHLKFDETLLWLARLATTLPEPADIISKVSKYSSDKLKRFDNPKQQELFWQLNYMLGRSKYKGRDFVEAISLLNNVNKGSKFFIPAQFYLGISYVEERQSSPAITAFQRILDGIDKGIQVEDEPRMRDLAYLSMARVYYTSAIKRDAATDTITVKAENLRGAIINWNKIDVGSEYWLDGLFEEAWAYFMAGDYPRSLGNIHAIQAPYFPKAWYPEAEILRAQIYYQTCQYDGAKSIVAKFKKRYEPMRDKLREVLKSFSGEGKEPVAFQFLKDLRANKWVVDESKKDIKDIVENALSDRVLLKHIEYVKMLDEEEGRFKKTPEAFRSSPLGKYTEEALGQAKEYAIQRAGALVQDKYSQNIEDVDVLLTDADKILIDITSAERGKLEQAAESGVFTQEDAKTFGVVKPDEEHVIWPFNGEYWRDELGFYRQVVISRCSR